MSSSSQLFKKKIPHGILFDILDKICFKTDKYYLIDINAYRKLLYYNLDGPLRDNIVNFYHNSKQFYVTREMTYNSFITVVRHICKLNNITYCSEMRYNESKYNINYLVYFNIVSDEQSSSIDTIESPTPHAPLDHTDNVSESGPLPNPTQLP